MASIPDHLQDRIDEYLSNQIDEAGLAELQSALQSDPQLREHFVRYSRLHTDLQGELRSRRLVDQFMEQLPTPSKSNRRWLPWSIAAALAFSLLIALLIPWRLENPVTKIEEEIAWVVNAQNCRWQENQEPQGSLRPGSRLVTLAGLLELRFRNGAKILLEGPADLELLSTQSVRLLEGKLTAKIPESAIGFEVLSAQGKVIDLGTEFGIAVHKNGSTDVHVFEGQVDAVAGMDAKQKQYLKQNQAVRLQDGKLLPTKEAPQFQRAIVPTPRIEPQHFVSQFDQVRSAGILDKTGQGIHLTHRLPGTGHKLPQQDPNLRLDRLNKHLELTTTNSDINGLVNMPTGEYLGYRLQDMGFTGKEDFEIQVSIPNIPALQRVGQFGLYVGTKADHNTRGGLIRKRSGEYTQFMTNNNGGRDADAGFIGINSPGDDTRILLRRIQGKYSMTVENLTTGNSSSLSIRHPDFLDSATDLYVGIFGANTQSNEPKTLLIKEIRVTVWKDVTNTDER